LTNTHESTHFLVVIVTYLFANFLHRCEKVKVLCFVVINALPV